MPSIAIMKELSNPRTRTYNILTRGIYTVNDSSLDTAEPKPKKEHRKWVYRAARVIIIFIAISCITGSFLLGMDGSWNIATTGFILAFVLFIPFVLYGRKIAEMKKAEANHHT
jgi:hypothetical protein